MELPHMIPANPQEEVRKLFKLMDERDMQLQEPIIGRGSAHTAIYNPDGKHDARYRLRQLIKEKEEKRKKAL